MSRLARLAAPALHNVRAQAGTPAARHALRRAYATEAAKNSVRPLVRASERLFMECFPDDGP